jgi:hypothetical protein
MDSDLRIDQRNDEIRVLRLEPPDELKTPSDVSTDSSMIHCHRQVVSLKALKALKAGRSNSPPRTTQARYTAVQDLWGHLSQQDTDQLISEGAIIGF